MSRHRSKKYSDREEKTAFILEFGTFGARAEAAKKRASKNPSVQLSLFEKAGRHSAWKAKHEEKVDRHLSEMFLMPGGHKKDTLSLIHYLQYLDLRARFARKSIYQVIRMRSSVRQALMALYWLPVKDKTLEGIEEVFLEFDQVRRSSVEATFAKHVYEQTRQFQLSIRREIGKLNGPFKGCLPILHHKNRLAKEILILCRGAEVGDNFQYVDECALPPAKFDGTPRSLRHTLMNYWDDNLLEAALGDTAGILDHGIFEVDFDALLEDGDWQSVPLLTSHNSAKRLKKKFEWVCYLKPQKSFKDLLLPDKIKADIESLVARFLEKEKQLLGEGLTFLFRGDPGTGKSLTAEAIANALGMNILRVNFSEVDIDTVSNMITFFASRAERTRSLLLFEECENIFRTNHYRGTSDGWAKVLFEKFQGVAVFTTNFDLDFGMTRRMNYVHEFEPETPELRFRILEQEIRNRAGEEDWKQTPSKRELLEVVTKHEVPGGYFQSILKLASALSSNEKLELTALEHAFAQRSKSMDKNKNGAETPIISLADVVMRPQQRNLVNRIIELSRTNRSSHPLLPKCVSAIFHGPPGTGKTLVAEAIAHELGKRIYKATAADLLSMFVGESEKAIRRLFSNAMEQDFILFIDEAEGLFRDRSAAVRNWELTQVNELLRQFDEFEGVVLLASNHKDAMDPAFARRIQFHVEFPMPNVTERRDLWRKFLGITQIPMEESDLALLSEGFTLSGGEIRNAVVQAQAHGTREIQPLCEICRVIERQRFGTSNRKMGLQASE